MSSIALATEDPVDEHSKRNTWLNHMDHCFTGVFAIEMFLKVMYDTPLLLRFTPSRVHLYMILKIELIIRKNSSSLGYWSRYHNASRFLSQRVLEFSGCCSRHLCADFVDDGNFVSWAWEKSIKCNVRQFHRSIYLIWSSQGFDRKRDFWTERKISNRQLRYDKIVTSTESFTTTEDYQTGAKIESGLRLCG